MTRSYGRQGRRHEERAETLRRKAARVGKYGAGR